MKPRLPPALLGSNLCLADATPAPPIQEVSGTFCFLNCSPNNTDGSGMESKRGEFRVFLLSRESPTISLRSPPFHTPTRLATPPPRFQ